MLKNLKTTAAALAIGAAASSAFALGDPALNNADDLIVREGETVTLTGGSHTFDDIVVSDDATLFVPAGVTITANRIHSDGGTIRYLEGSGNGATPTVTLIAFDASNVRDLTVIGHGRDGENATQTPAQAGKNGRNACSRYDPFNWCDRRAERGGNGAHGVRGGNGEDGVQVTAYFVGAEPGALVRFNSVGGDGGIGQPGGRAGDGGNRSTLHQSASGGTGGNGGAGGDAGDSGRVTIYLVADSAEVDANPDWVKIAANLAAGRPGEGGERGATGRRGQPGMKGPNGSHGMAPVDEHSEDFAQVLLMDRDTFAQFALANQVISN
ncbi:hypothetical protein [Leisingera sp. S232]|uniref:hypothetical protein n=1 Tax=Leisingera sp. S232 TaxID=3415132 RepID=UPI003C79A259